MLLRNNAKVWIIDEDRDDLARFRIYDLISGTVCGFSRCIARDERLFQSPAYLTLRGPFPCEIVTQ